MCKPLFFKLYDSHVAVKTGDLDAMNLGDLSTKFQ
jgi:hypothetical protein